MWLAVPVSGSTHLSTRNNTVTPQHQSYWLASDMEAGFVDTMNFSVWHYWIYNGKRLQFFFFIFLHFFLDFFWLMLHALQNFESRYRSSWFTLQGHVYISTNLSDLLLFKVIGIEFVDFCWAVTAWIVMRNLCYFSEMQLLMLILKWIEAFCSHLDQLYGEDLFICKAIPSHWKHIIYTVFDRDLFYIHFVYLNWKYIYFVLLYIDVPH